VSTVEEKGGRDDFVAAPDFLEAQGYPRHHRNSEPESVSVKIDPFDFLWVNWTHSCSILRAPVS
jgi:hypothetical protein